MRTLRVIFVIILCITFLSCRESQARFLLQVENWDTGEVLLNIPVKSGDQFYLDYIHSVSKTPIRDVFQISSKGEVILVEEDFEWYGSGLEFINHGGVRIIDSEREGSRVLLKRYFPVLLLRVGWLTNQQFTFNGKAISLLDIANGGELLQVSIVKTDALTEKG